MPWSENTSTERPRLVAKQVQKSIPSHLQAILDIRKNKLEASTSLQELQVVPAHQEEVAEAPRAVLEHSRAIQKNVLSSDTAVSINAQASTVFCPSTPSAMIKVTQIDL